MSFIVLFPFGVFFPVTLNPNRGLEAKWKTKKILKIDNSMREGWINVEKSVLLGNILE